MPTITKFTTTLLISLVLAFLVHIFFLNYMDHPLFGDKIIEAYLANFIMAALIYTSLFLLRKKYLEQLGFIFMFGSMIKFIVFFIFFNPYFKSDGNISAFEFASFFIPYAISLILETLGVIKFLKK
ncbi:MAG: hypothetical protein ABFR05_08440 [Bacteroidota bacterium]